MPSKHYVFSARTTEAGLKLLNQLKETLGISWDELVIDAVSAHYRLDRKLLAVPRAEKPAKVEAKGQPKAEAKGQFKAEAPKAEAKVEKQQPKVEPKPKEADNPTVEAKQAASVKVGGNGKEAKADKPAAVIATAETKPTQMPKATAKKINGRKAGPAKKS